VATQELLLVTKLDAVASFPNQLGSLLMAQQSLNALGQDLQITTWQENNRFRVLLQLNDE
jgi:hypothetical protein